MNIPNEAVEAAAEAMYEFKYEYKAWDEAKSPDSWRAHALVTLEAATPHLLRDIVKAWTNNGPYADVSHSNRVDAVREAFPGLAHELDKLK